MGNSFIVPVPPSVNNLYHNVGKKRRMTTAGKEYKMYAGLIAKQWALENDWEYEGGNVAMGLDLFFPNKIRRDITNCIKIVEDAVSEALGFDDKKCTEFVVKLMGYDKENPRAIFTLVNGSFLRSCQHCYYFKKKPKPQFIGECTLPDGPAYGKRIPDYFGCNWFDTFIPPFELETI